MGPGDITPKFWKKRYRQINDYERYLTENGTVIIKFFLNVSKEEQKRRFLSRLEDEAKELEIFRIRPERAQLLGRLYEGLFGYVDPYFDGRSTLVCDSCDNKLVMRYAVGQILCDRMNELDLHYPEMPVEARHQIEDFKRALLNE